MSTRGPRKEPGEAREDDAIRRSRSEAHEEARAAAEDVESSDQDPRSLDFTRRLRRLYEISTLLTRFESAERTVPTFLELVSEALPLRSAICLLAEEGDAPCVITWRAELETDDELREAEAKARLAYRYLVRGTVDEARAAAPASPASQRGNDFIVLPLVIARQPIFGVLQLEGANPFDELDLTFVNAVVNQLAIALDRQQVIDARQEIAEAGERGQRLLAQVGAIVGASLDSRATLAAVADSVVPQFADLYFFDEVEADGSLKRREMSFADQARQQELAERLRGLVLRCHASALATRRPVLFEDFAELVGEGIGPDEEETLRSAGVESMLVVPLVVRGQLRVQTFATAESGRRYTTRELHLAEEIAQRAATAIDNARLFEQAQDSTLARENLLAVVSHDLKNPLGAILVNAALALKAPVDDQDEHKRLAAIQRSALQMNRMLGDLLDAASIESGHLSMDKRRLDMVAVIGEELEALQPLAAKKSQRLEATLPAELPAFGDGARLHQVMANLVGNAIKFTREGGSITVGANTSGGWVTVSIADEGPGIPEGDIPRVFGRFWQAQRTARKGTGLGLFIVKGIVEAHGGSVWVESEVGAGSTFFFTIPAAPA